MRIVSVVGARPQFMKIAALSPLLRKKQEELIVHTGQHYDFELSQIFFDQLKLPKPDFFLGVGSDTNARQAAKMVAALDELLPKLKPDLVLVYGDTNSTLAGALASAYNKIPFAHVEAGPRSYQMEMPEEINRVTADHLAAYLFCPTPQKVKLLKSERVRGKAVHTGDVMLDVTLKFLPLARQNGIGAKLGVSPGEYAYLTLHRAENVDTPSRLAKAVRILESLKGPIVFPVHPRTRKRLEEFGLLSRVQKLKNLRFIEPVGYLQSLALLDGARLCLTDSGGLQREAFFLSRPCLILRPKTEWTELLRGNCSRLVDLEVSKVKRFSSARPGKKKYPLKLFGGGRAAEKIARFISAL
ncbi:MAG: UDP-N-acetylglucosamine 2-epimerase (non-hydrolyzing) [candidate division Zixibacteria bacterium]|nr:UDP-N-acetylglucosamine 2-epimerase (non-hydrolyzing) [candidate division Zixibacteria bacterium]MCI0595796.1 UDP-N-acetylglucosamine 2-epimerase (non-hydrolyzing) [candidate division Zixibacteria bacterium]